MKGNHTNKSKMSPKAAPSGKQGNGQRFEWPFLIYPVLFAITLVILYVVNLSIQKDLPTFPVQSHLVQERTTATGHPRTPDTATSVQIDGSKANAQSSTTAEQPREAPRTAAYPPSTQEHKPADDTGRPPFAAGNERTSDIDQLQGADRIVAILRMAVSENDHARMKECLDELVALGDAAVVPLNDLVRAEDVASLWAAEALARIGTPMATTALLDTLSQTKEGLYKEELGKRVASISNHDSWPTLLDNALQTGDATVLRAAGASLSRMADTPVVDGIIDRYGTVTTEAEMERLAQLLSNIESPSATEALLSLAGPVSSAPQDSLQQAAINALAKVGDAQAVSHLLQRLEATPPGEGTALFNSITQINRPEAQMSLLYAAAGNKEVSAGYGRTAAIYALKNFPDTKTCELLEQIIATTDNEQVLAAATRTLDDIRLAPHAVTAKADSTEKEEYILPAPPAKK